MAPEFDSSKKQHSAAHALTGNQKSRGVFLTDNRTNNRAVQLSGAGVAQLRKSKNKNNFRGLKVSLQEFHQTDDHELDRRLTMEKIRSGKKNIRIQNSTFVHPVHGNKSFKNQTLEHLDELSQTELGHEFLKSLLATEKPITIKQSSNGRNTTSTTSTGVKEELAQHPLVADWIAKRGRRILHNSLANRVVESQAKEAGGTHVEKYLEAEAQTKDEAVAATDGRGTGSIVEINPSTQHYGNGQQPWQTERPKYGLYHELVHALHKGRGTEATGNHNNVHNKEWQVLGEGPYEDEEYSEKTIRAAMGKDERPDYDGAVY
ncbi:MAG TPA: M91 family zinc metallopeptidase [Flavobacteriales bacterium]|nr:M91 family zinc metallopeptidase [Flavobacteriales bacterium]